MNKHTGCGAVFFWALVIFVCSLFSVKAGVIAFCLFGVASLIAIISMIIDHNS